MRDKKYFSVVSSDEIRSKCQLILSLYEMGLGGETGEKEITGRPRCRWVDNIRIDLHEVGGGYMD